MEIPLGAQPAEDTAPIWNLLTSDISKGMCLSFARSYCRLVAGEQVARDMAATVRAGSASDVLWVYRRALSRLAASPDNSEVTNLRHLYIAMIGYGSLESSGKYCNGRDMNNDESDTRRDRGVRILQTSYNTIKGPGHEPIRRGIAALTAQYAAHPEKGFLWIFQGGLWLPVGENHATLLRHRPRPTVPGAVAPFSAFSAENFRCQSPLPRR